MQIKIISCPNAMLWYNQHIGEEFMVLREEDKAYWVRELDHPYCLNWVYKQDVEVLPKPVVYYDKDWQGTNVELNASASVYAFNHPRLGYRWVVTSTVQQITAESFETYNTMYKACTQEEFMQMQEQTKGTSNAVE